jgi:hypothetical protein
MYHLWTHFDSTRRHLNTIKKLYEVEKVSNKVQDGIIPYPGPKDGDQDHHPGMSFELRYVSLNFTVFECR